MTAFKAEVSDDGNWFFESQNNKARAIRTDSGSEEHNQIVFVLSYCNKKFDYPEAGIEFARWQLESRAIGQCLKQLRDLENGTSTVTNKE